MTMESITDILQRLKELSEQDEQHFFKYIDQVLMKDRLHLIKPHEIADLVMGTHNEPSAVSLLFDILGSHPDEPPRLAAGKILFAADKSPYSKYEQKNIDVLTGCLESGMASDTQTIRNGCMWAMFKLTGTRAFEICSRVFLHHKPEVRLEIARLYGFLRDKRATPGLVMALEMESIPRIRSTILWALGYIKDPRATRILIDFLNDKNPEAGGYAAWALGEIGGIEAGMALAKVMTDESRNEEVRGWAAKAFLKTGIGKQSEITGETPQIMSSKDKAASITCKCGFSNSSTNRWCIQCGRELP